MNNVNRTNWKSLILFVAIGAAVTVGVAYYAYYRANSESSAPALPPAPDPALVAQTSARASSGEVPAQLQMGIWCLEGRHSRPDYAAAAMWLGKAAEAGDAEAQYRLGTLYQTGRGAGLDLTKALFWFNKAASQQHVAAMYNLGAMYEAGQGVAPDTQAAAGFFRRAAEFGDAYAQYNMARRCEEGHGVPKNLVEAWKWYELADAGGVADTLRARQSLASRLTVEQRREAQQAVEDFRRHAAKPGLRKP